MVGVELAWEPSLGDEQRVSESRHSSADRVFYFPGSTYLVFAIDALTGDSRCKPTRGQWQVVL